jgi:hypothetical protein
MGRLFHIEECQPDHSSGFYLTYHSILSGSGVMVKGKSDWRVGMRRESRHKEEELPLLVDSRRAASGGSWCVCPHQSVVHDFPDKPPSESVSCAYQEKA